MSTLQRLLDANRNTSFGQIHLASELTWVTGTTTLPEAVFVDQTFEVDNGGGVLRLWLERPSDVFGFELGYASGDANRYDHHVRNFQFDPNYRVGMLIFPTVNAQHMLISAQNAAIQIIEKSCLEASIDASAGRRECALPHASMGPQPVEQEC